MIDGLDSFVRVWGRPGFKYDIGLEGSVDYVFGCRAGSTSNVFNLSHEISHVIQLTKEERLLKWEDGSLRLFVPRIWIIDRFCCEPVTDKISRRELETFVIQYLMHNEVEPISLVKFFARNSVFDLFNWLPDYYLFHKGAWNRTREFKRFVLKESEVLLNTKWNIEKVKKIWEDLEFY